MCIVGVFVVSFGWNRYRDWWSVATILAVWRGSVLALLGTSVEALTRRFDLVVQTGR